MRLFILIIFSIASAGCAPDPLRQCSYTDTGWVVLDARPANETELLALAGIEKNSRTSHRDTWLQNSQGDLMYCEYRVRPVPSGRCGTSAFTFKNFEGLWEADYIHVTTC